MTDKIQFACPHCSSTLAVALAHAGKTAKCPVCSSSVTVPPSGGSNDASLAAADPISVPPGTPSSPFGSHGSGSANSAGRGLFDDVDAFGTASGKSLPAGPSSLEKPQRDGWNAGNGMGSFEQPDRPRSTGTGRSIAGLAAAMGVGLAAMIVWLVLAAMSGYELGILAWAIGGLIGFVAGVIAKNPSPVYCGMAALIAMGAILSAKLIMALAIVALHFVTTTIEDASTLLEGDKYSHAFVDQALADNLFTDEKKQLAVDFNDGFFESSDEEDAEADEDEVFASGQDEDAEKPGLREFFREMRERVAAATEQEKAAWLANAHQRHPLWIEEYSHYEAAVIELAAQPAQLDPELAAHAAYVLSSQISQDAEFDDTYETSLAPAEYRRRDRQLDVKCGEFLRDKSPTEIDALLRNCMQKHPTFNPYPDEFTATLEKMSLDGSLDESLQAHAKLYLDTELGPLEEMGYFEAKRTPEFLAADQAMRQAVTARLVTMDDNAMKAVLSETRARHPDWYVLEDEAEMPDVEEFKRELGDGTFVGSLKMVFGVYDLLWLFLGATTAYGTAMARAKKS